MMGGTARLSDIFHVRKMIRDNPVKQFRDDGGPALGAMPP